jgi:hypothetical protein
MMLFLKEAKLSKKVSGMFTYDRFLNSRQAVAIK